MKKKTKSQILAQIETLMSKASDIGQFVDGGVLIQNITRAIDILRESVQNGSTKPR